MVIAPFAMVSEVNPVIVAVVAALPTAVMAAVWAAWANAGDAARTACAASIAASPADAPAGAAGPLDLVAPSAGPAAPQRHVSVADQIDGRVSPTDAGPLGISSAVVSRAISSTGTSIVSRSAFFRPASTIVTGR